MLCRLVLLDLLRQYHVVLIVRGELLHGLHVLCVLWFRTQLRPCLCVITDYLYHFDFAAAFLLDVNLGRDREDLVEDGGLRVYLQPGTRVCDRLWRALGIFVFEMEIRPRHSDWCRPQAIQARWPFLEASVLLLGLI